MGCFDTVLVPCPECGKLYPAQSKGGDCICLTYSLEDAPDDVLSNVNRHAPFTCDCGTVFKVVSDLPVVRTELVKALAEKWAIGLINYDEVKSTMELWNRSSYRAAKMTGSKFRHQRRKKH